MNIHLLPWKARGRESGQSIVLITLMLMAFVAMLALVLDGGLAYASRRTAQNAADAGALAGASELCRTGSAIAAENLAVSYATSNNDATSASATANTGNSTITVNTTVTYNTTFAALFGNPTGNAIASARAGCFPVCSAKDVLPVAWSCDASFSGGTCNTQFGDIDGAPADQPLYLIMDSSSLTDDIACQDPPNSGGTGIDCDTDNDGNNDTLNATAERSWLNLDGGPANANELRDWINDGVPFLTRIHSWVPGGTGVSDSVFTAAESLVNRVITLPVYDRLPCEIKNNETISGICPSLWDAGDIQEWDDANTYFHIAALAPFKVTCVHGSQHDPDNCIAFDSFVTENDDILTNGDINKLRTIEGYFIEGYVGEMRRCPAGTVPDDYGSYTVNLIP